MPTAYADFVGQKRGYGCSYALELGSSPGVATVSAPPDFGRIDKVGPLDIHYEGKLFLRLHDCRLANPTSPSGTTQSPAVQWRIEDERWKWQYGAKLDGDYNVEQKDGSLLREKSPRQLAELIFDALGMANRDVAALPKDTRPRKIWRAADPKDELDRLCQEYGCAPAYNPWNREALVVKLGDGSGPPRRAHASRTDGINAPAVPDHLVIVGGDTLFQTALKLGEWLALEVDGTYVDMDAVSYKPALGWGWVDPRNFSQLNTTYVDKATGRTLYHRELASQSIYRVARITGQVSGGFSPAALKGTPDEPQGIQDLGPFQSTVLERDPLTGDRMPIFARGVFQDPKRYAITNTPPKTRWHSSVSINSELRTVTFGEPCFTMGLANDGSREYQPATDMEVIAAYAVAKDGVPVYYSLGRAPFGRVYGAGDYREHRDDIVREIIEKSASSTGAKQDNKDVCDKLANYYLAAIQDQFTERPAYSLTYSGLERFVPDGRLRSVSWSFSTSKLPETSVSWDCERNNYIRAWENTDAARAKRQIDAAQRRKAAADAREASRKGALA